MFGLVQTAFLFLTGQRSPMARDCTGQPSDTLRAVTFNIRFDGSPAPPIPTSGSPTFNLSSDLWGEKRWSERRYKVADTITYYDPDVFGLQEALVNQMKDLTQLLGEVYDHVGVGRDDGKEAGEYVPIFFKKTRFDLLEVNHFWLSDDPSSPGSVGWDASQTRMCTIASLIDKTHPLFSDKPGSAVFHIANTHYDDRGILARAQSSLLIRRKLPEVISDVEKRHAIMLASGAEPTVVLLGDFNSPEDEEGYRNMVATIRSPISFHDTRYSLTLAPGKDKLWAPFGPTYTYTGFSPYDQPQRIDFIFLGTRKRNAWKVARYGVLENKFEGGRGAWQGLSSDHRAVLTEFCR